MFHKSKRILATCFSAILITGAIVRGQEDDLRDSAMPESQDGLALRRIGVASADEEGTFLTNLRFENDAIVGGHITVSKFEVDAGVTVTAVEDLVVTSQEDIIIRGQLRGVVKTASSNDPDGVGITLRTPKTIFILGQLRPGDGLDGTYRVAQGTTLNADGSAGGSLILEAAKIVTASNLAAGDGGNGGPGGRGGDGGSVVVKGAVIPVNGLQEVTLFGGKGGDGSDGELGQAGGDGGNGGDADASSGRNSQNGDPGEDGENASGDSGVHGQDGDACESGTQGTDGADGIAGEGGDGGAGGNGVPPNGNGSAGGNGGDGGSAWSGNGGSGGHGGHCCDPDEGQGGTGAAARHGGHARAGKGGDGGQGGNGVGEGFGGNGGNGGAGGYASSGSGGHGGNGGDGVPIGFGGLHGGYGSLTIGLRGVGGLGGFPMGQNGVNGVPGDWAWGSTGNAGENGKPCPCEEEDCGCPQDLDGSGGVDAGDLAIVLGSWGPCGQCVADFNGDGVVNAGDLAVVLGSWGACPQSAVCGDGVVGEGEQCDPPDGVTCDDNCQVFNGVCHYPDIRTIVADADLDPPDIQQNYDAINATLHLFGGMSFESFFFEPLDVLSSVALERVETLETCAGVPIDAVMVAAALEQIMAVGKGLPLVEVITSVPGELEEVKAAIDQLRMQGIGFPPVATTDFDADLKLASTLTLVDEAGVLEYGDYFFKDSSEVSEAQLFAITQANDDGGVLDFQVIDADNMSGKGIVRNNHCCNKGACEPDILDLDQCDVMEDKWCSLPHAPPPANCALCSIGSKSCP